MVRAKELLTTHPQSAAHRGTVGLLPCDVPEPCLQSAHRRNAVEYRARTLPSPHDGALVRVRVGRKCIHLSIIVNNWSRPSTLG